MRLAADLGVRLNSMLQDLGKAAEGIRGSVLVDRSGLPIAGTVRAKQDLNVIAAMSTMITRSATRVFESLGLHHPGIIIMEGREANVDRKSTRLNSSHVSISYAVFCLKK